MYPAKFDYYRAASVEEAVALLHRHRESKVLAGGHSLLPIMKLRLAHPRALVDIGHIHILRGISHHDGTLRIGALTTHGEIAASELLREECPLLAEAASHIGDPQVRNKGTIGGNVAHADPASDLPAALVALGATIHIAGPAGNRSAAARSFFTSLLETEIGENEILTAVDVPRMRGPFGTCYLKVEHPASGYAICGAAAIVRGGRASAGDVELAYNGITDTPHRARSVGQALVGTSMTDAEIDRAVDDHLSIEDPLGDVQASGEYRIELARVYGKRAMKTARDRGRE